MSEKDLATDTGAVLAHVTADDVEWVCEHADGTREACFETGLAVSAMLAAEVLFVNAPWYREDLSDGDKAVARLLVAANDVFAWACADAEPLPMAEIPRLYAMWRADPDWGGAAWAVMQRGVPPQGPVAERLAALGVWDPARLVPDPADPAGTGRAYLDARLSELKAPATERGATPA